MFRSASGGRFALVFAVVLSPGTAASIPELDDEGDARPVHRAPPFWGGLEPGEHAVGFSSHWELDAARRYRCQVEGAEEDGERPRPVLVNCWYPAQAAEGSPMTHGEYFELDADPHNPALVDALIEYQRSIVSSYVIGDDAARVERELPAVLATPTAAHRDAEPAPGPHPLVQYHAGYGSSFEDHSVLCEWLASHGFVVVGSAYLEGSGESFNIDAEEDSFRDLELLHRWAATQDFVDPDRSALIGHSGGAHATLRYAAQPSRAVDALVAIDTTQDAHSLLDPRWDRMIEGVLAGAEHVHQPLLMIANPNAYFPLGDVLSGAPRWYYTVRDLDHDTMITQGTVHSDLHAEATDRDTKASAEATRDSFERLCHFIADFLRAHLRDDEASRGRLSQYADTPSSGPLPHVDFMAPGQDAPPDYDFEGEAPPTLRQLRPILDSEGVDALVELLERFGDDPRAAVLHESICAQSLLCELVHSDRADEAEVLFAHLKSVHPGITGSLMTWFDYFSRVGRWDDIEWFLVVAETLDPTHPTVRSWRSKLDAQAEVDKER